MRTATIDGRMVIITDGRAIDVATASDGAFGPDALDVLERWGEFRAWAVGATLGEGQPFAVEQLGAPVPNPRQVFAIGLNYRAHAEESNISAPTLPAVFTKFPASIAGPVSTVCLPPGGHVDWEVELVVVIGKRARFVTGDEVWEHVAGLSVGQDLSERIRQLDGAAPQFSMGKSYEGFAPFGPYLTTPDELADPEDLELSCTLDGEVMQRSRTSNMIHDVRALVVHLSAILPLLPGDLIFTGTPSGVGVARKPQRFIQPGEVLVSTIEGLGDIRQDFVAAR
ncbi:MAG: fumarylacetoacetate hydrolase family protein [Vicinamibacterales bacterium]